MHAHTTGRHTTDTRMRAVALTTRQKAHRPPRANSTTRQRHLPPPHEARDVIEYLSSYAECPLLYSCVVRARQLSYRTKLAIAQRLIYCTDRRAVVKRISTVCSSQKPARRVGSREARPASAARRAPAHVVMRICLPPHIESRRRRGHAGSSAARARTGRLTPHTAPLGTAAGARASRS